MRVVAAVADILRAIYTAFGGTSIHTSSRTTTNSFTTNPFKMPPKAAKGEYIETVRGTPD